MDWRHEAACLDEDPELHFPIGDTEPALLQTEKAKAVCRRCDVADTCLQWALDTKQEFGVWGGLSEKERRAVKRRQARARRANPDQAAAADPTAPVDLRDIDGVVKVDGALAQAFVAAGVKAGMAYAEIARLGGETGDPRWIGDLARGGGQITVAHHTVIMRAFGVGDDPDARPKAAVSVNAEPARVLVDKAATEQGLSNRQIAARLGVSPDWVHGLRKGRPRVLLEKHRAAVAAFGSHRPGRVDPAEARDLIKAAQGRRVPIKDIAAAIGQGKTWVGDLIAGRLGTISVDQHERIVTAFREGAIPPPRPLPIRPPRRVPSGPARDLATRAAAGGVPMAEIGAIVGRSRHWARDLTTGRLETVRVDYYDALYAELGVNRGFALELERTA